MAVRKPVSLSPPPNLTDNTISQQIKNWFVQLYDRVGGGPFMLAGYSKNSLPSASDWASLDSTTPFTSLIWVYDATGTPVVAYSDGTNWKRIDTNVNI